MTMILAVEHYRPDADPGTSLYYTFDEPTAPGNAVARVVGGEHDGMTFEIRDLAFVEPEDGEIPILSIEYNVMVPGEGAEETRDDVIKDLVHDMLVRACEVAESDLVEREEEEKETGDDEERTAGV